MFKQTPSNYTPMAKSPIDHNVVVKYFRAVKLVKAIQGRLAAVITNLPHREKHIKIPVPKDQRDSLACISNVKACC